MWGRALLAWLVLLAAAIANGTARQAWLVSRLGDTVGRAVSSLLLALLIVAIAIGLVRWIAPSSPGQAWAIGAAWLALTLAFEFGFGRARGIDWAALLADYDLRRGRIWLVVLVATLVAPWLAGRTRGLWR